VAHTQEIEGSIPFPATNIIVNVKLVMTAEYTQEKPTRRPWSPKRWEIQQYLKRSHDLSNFGHNEWVGIRGIGGRQ